MSHGALIPAENVDDNKQITIKEALKDISLLAFPNLLIFVLTNCNDMTSLIFISNTGKEEYISAVGLSILVLGMFGLQPLYALSVSVDTLVSQSFGKGDFKLCGEHLNKAFALLGISLVPAILCILCTSPLLQAMGFEKSVAELAGAYCSRMIFFVIASTTFYMLNRFLNAQTIAFPQMIFIGISTALHPLWCYIFIFVLDQGCFGLNWAYSITALINLVGLVGYIFFSHCCDNCFVMPGKSIFNDMGEFLKIACAGELMVVLEWWGYYILMLFAGYFDALAVATNQIVANVDIFFYMIPTAIGSALTAMVGNSLGKCKAREAKLYAAVAVSMDVAIIATLILSFFILRRAIVKFYTPNTDIQDLYVSAMPVALCSFFFDCIQGVLSKIFIAQGKQIYATITNGVMYYLFMLPIGYVFVYILNWSIYGLWTAGALNFVAVTAIFGTIIYFQDWEALAAEVHRKSSLDIDEAKLNIKDLPEQNNELKELVHDDK